MSRVLMMPSYRYRQTRHCLWRCCDLLFVLNISVVQTMKETKGFGISTDVFKNVIVSLSEVDTIAVVISEQ